MRRFLLTLAVAMVALWAGSPLWAQNNRQNNNQRGRLIRRPRPMPHALNPRPSSPVLRRRPFGPSPAAPLDRRFNPGTDRRPARRGTTGRLPAARPTQRLDLPRGSTYPRGSNPPTQLGQLP